MSTHPHLPGCHHLPSNCNRNLLLLASPARQAGRARCTEGAVSIIQASLQELLHAKIELWAELKSVFRIDFSERKGHQAKASCIAADAACFASRTWLELYLYTCYILCHLCHALQTYCEGAKSLSLICHGKKVQMVI